MAPWPGSRSSGVPTASASSPVSLPSPACQSDSAYKREENYTWLLDLHLHCCVTLRKPLNRSDLIMCKIGIMAHLTGLLRRVTEIMNKNKQWVDVGCSCRAGESSLIPDSSPSATQTPAIWSPWTLLLPWPPLLPDCKIRRLLHSNPLGLPAVFGTVAYSFLKNSSPLVSGLQYSLGSPPTSLAISAPSLPRSRLLSGPQSQGLLFVESCVCFSWSAVNRVYTEKTQSLPTRAPSLTIACSRPLGTGRGKVLCLVLLDINPVDTWRL